ncbi:MAG TPA: DUF2314 domain-containing protein, partial [Bacteroidia bacterium]
MSFFKKIFGKDPKKNVTRRDGQPDVINVANDEQRMNFAMEKARLTIGYFKRSLAHPMAGQTYFSLKAKVIDGEAVEHLWLNTISFDERGNAHGNVGNKPVNVRNVSMGKRISVPPEHVSDWMIVEKGKLVGGYTIRAIRENVEEKDRPAFDKSINLVIDEGEDHFPHDRSTPEGAILCLEDAYDEQNLEKAIRCKDFIMEARMMLSKLKMPVDDALIDSTAEVLQLSFVKQLKDNGFPSFKGLRRAFP